MTKIKDQIEYWDKVSSSKTFGHPLDWDHLNSFLSPDSKILDFGCGYGRLCGELWNRGFRQVIGVDSSPKMVELAKRNYPKNDFRMVENSQLPFDQKSFDVVLLFTVLTSTPANSEQEKIVNEGYRVLQEGGIFYISDLQIQKDQRNQERYHKFAKKYETFGIFELPDGGVMRHHEMSWINSLVNQFDQLSLKEINVLTMNGHKVKAFQYIGRKV